MDLLIRLLKNVINALIISAILSAPVHANQKKSYNNRNNILATSYVVQDIDTGEIVTEKNKEEIRSIASITKLMTAIVVLDAKQDLSEKIVFHKPTGTTSKLPKGTVVTRADLLLLSLMSSDNSAAALLAELYPGGTDAAIKAMNQKAFHLQMYNSHFSDPTGLDPNNVSTATDLIKLTSTAYNYDDIRNFSTKSTGKIQVQGKKKSYFIDFKTTNSLVTNTHNVLLSKTGWIRISGGCLVMIVKDQGRRLAVILLNSRNTQTRIRDGALLTEYDNARNHRNFR